MQFFPFRLCRLDVFAQPFVLALVSFREMALSHARPRDMLLEAHARARAGRAPLTAGGLADHLSYRFAIACANAA